MMEGASGGWDVGCWCRGKWAGGGWRCVFECRWEMEGCGARREGVENGEERDQPTAGVRVLGGKRMQTEKRAGDASEHALRHCKAVRVGLVRGILGV